MVDLSGVFGAAFAGVYDDAVLHRPGKIQDTAGTITRGQPSEHPCKAQVDAATQAMRGADGFVETDVRILVLASTVGVAASTDDEIVTGGRRWKIASVSQDPARTHWEMRGRRTNG